MKRIEAIIRPTKIAKVCAALREVDHHRLMISQVENRGGTEATPYQLRGKTYRAGLLTNAKIEVIAGDREAERIVDAIRDAAFTGGSGDGEIYVHTMNEAIRIGSGGAAA